MNRSARIPVHVLPVIVIAQFACTSLWFAGNAAAGDLQRDFDMGEGAVGNLTAAVQVGFIAGTLLFALLAVADRFSPVRVFFLSSLAGALFNLAPWALQGWAPHPAGAQQLLMFRFLTGICLAGIYPVGMKIASDWHEKGLGKALGYLVGALVLGTAFPHLLKGLGSQLSWKMILPATSVLAFFGGLLILLTLQDGPYRQKAQRFSWRVIPQIFQFREFRNAAYGYFGHMWELYAWWTFVPAFIAAFNRAHAAVPLSVPFWSFAAIGMGSLGCILGGYWSLKIGSPKVAFGMLAVSGGCCCLSPLIISMPPLLFLSALLVWGFAVVGDSPQFTSTVARTAPGAYVGTALTLVNCLGFSLTIASIQLLTAVQNRISPAYWFLLLLPGPVFGLLHIRRSVKSGTIAILLALLCCTLGGNTFAQNSGRSKPKVLQVEGQGNSQFTSLATPRFSWKIRSTERDVRQTAYQIRVFAEADFSKKDRHLLWNSGKVSSDQSVLVPYGGPALQSRTRYTWQVKIWDNHSWESAWSEPVWWETALSGPVDWEAKWIGVPWTEAPDVPSPCPNFSAAFQANKKVLRARLYVTAHGLYEAFLNGKRVGDQLFTPGWTSYHKRLQYQTYDVTELLKKGGNEVAVTLGDGWWRGYMGFGVKPKNRNVYGTQLALLFQLEMIFTDGSRQTVVSGPDWKANTGAIQMSDLYNGEMAYESLPGSTPQLVKVLDFPLDNLLPAEGPPVRVTEVRQPIAVLTTPKGETVYDFGQNLVGRVRFWVHGKAGETITLHHAEVLDSAGNFYTENLRTARQELRYTLTTTAKQEYAPHFSFMGFRYVRVQGLKPDSLVAEVIHSDMPPAGRFSCSDSLINRLQENIRWGQRSNFLDVPTDCPQRDERMGWTGDAQAFCYTAAFNYNVADFFQKWLKDLSADQLPDGRVPHVIPQVMRPRDSGAAGWADAATIVPWAMFQVYGDTTFLSRQFPAMKNWVDYIAKQAGDSCLWRNGTHFGDWVFYSVNDDRDGKSAITEKDFIAQAFFVHSLDLVQRGAAILGKKEEAAFYARLMEKARKAFQEEFVTATGRLTSGTQTAYVLALAFDLLPENQREPAAARLVDNIRRYNHLTTGFLGTPLLCPVLTRFGYTDVAYRLLERKKYPSWLYPVTRGATTIWERWDGIRPDGTFQTPTMNSFNHYAYGAIGDWLYRTVAGLDADVPGYRHLLLQPHPGGSLKWAKAEYETPYGHAACGWRDESNQDSLDRKDRDKIKSRMVEVEVPPNTTATVRIPGVKREDVTEQGKPLHTGNGILAIREEKEGVIVEVGSGRYLFLSKL